MSGKTRQFFSFLVFTATLMIAAATLMGSFCNTRDTLRTVREAHTTVRSAFATLDTAMAPLLEDAGSQCESRPVMDEWRVCMERWNSLRVAVSVAHDVLAELEAVYDDIENGADAGWRAIAIRLLAHGRRITEILVTLAVPVPEEFTDGLDMVCGLVNCEGE